MGSVSESADMRRIFEALPGLYLALTPDLVVVAATDSLVTTLDVAREELIDHSLLEVISDVAGHNGVAARSWKESIEQVLATKEAHIMGLTRYPFRTEDPSGNARFWESTNVPVTDENGEVVYILHQTIEVFPQRRSAETEARNLLALLDDAPAAVALFVGEDLIIHTANAAILKMWGRTSSVIGMALRDALPEVVPQGVLELLLGVYRTGTPFRADQILVAIERGGALRDCWFDLIYVPAREPTGEITGVFAFAYEVTGFVVARAEAQAANRLKDDFLTSLSHELRTPLTSILGWSALLNDHPDDVNMRKQGLTTILSNARAQARIVDDVLDVSRIISGKMTLALDRTEIGEILDASIAVLTPAAQAKEITITSDIEPIGPFSADSDRLRQIFWNLLSNAVKFTPPRGTIAIKARRQGTLVSISVSDNGIGIAPEHLEYVFERFRQVDAGTTRARGGLGLGLAIARHLAELHGGTVTAASEGIGKGSVFKVLLPIRAVHGPRPLRLPAPRPEELAARPLSGLEILLVEDEDDARELVRIVLEVAGAVVIAVSTAAEGMATIARHLPDILISDIGMEHEDGYSFMRRLRSLPDAQAARLPSIALTAYARIEDRDAVLAAGFQEFLAKPVEPDLLVETVRVLTRAKSSSTRH